MPCRLPFHCGFCQEAFHSAGALSSHAISQHDRVHVGGEFRLLQREEDGHCSHWRLTFHYLTDNLDRAFYASVPAMIHLVTKTAADSTAQEVRFTLGIEVEKAREDHVPVAMKGASFSVTMKVGNSESLESQMEEAFNVLEANVRRYVAGEDGWSLSEPLFLDAAVRRGPQRLSSAE